MTQPQYGYPLQGGYPAPPYQPDPYAQPGYVPTPPHGGGYLPAPNGYAPPGYGQQAPPYGQPPMPPVPQGAKGTLDDFYQQPSQGSGKGLTWNNAPNGYTYVGVVTRTPADGDVFQDSDPKSKQLKTFSDGRPKLVLPVQLRLVWQDALQQQNFPDQDARMFLRGGLRDEVTRAMQEVGESGVPKQGALVIVTLTHRKPGNNIATNVYAVTYRPQGTWETDPAFAAVAQQLAQPAPAPQASAAPQQAPYQQQAPAYAPAPAPAYPNPQQYAQAPQYGQAPVGGGVMPTQAGQPPAQQAAPQYGGQAYDPNQAQVQQPYQAAPNAYPQAPQDQGTQQPQGAQVNPSQGQAPGGYAPQPQYTQPQLPMTAPAGALPPQGQPPTQPGVQPSGLSPEKQALMNRLSGGQGQAGPMGASQQPQG
jgi:hypothetical protein